MGVAVGNKESRMQKTDKKETMQEKLRRIAGVESDVLAHVKGGLGSLVSPIRIILM